MARLTAANLLSAHWTPNRDHSCYAIVASAVQLHTLAYAMCGHIFVSDNRQQLRPVDKCKLVQKLVIDTLRRCEPPLAHVSLEIASLDMIRNCFSRLNEISRRLVVSHWSSCIVMSLFPISASPSRSCSGASAVSVIIGRLSISRISLVHCHSERCLSADIRQQLAGFRDALRGD